jgi:hypothetical protein
MAYPSVSAKFGACENWPCTVSVVAVFAKIVKVSRFGLLTNLTVRNMPAHMLGFQARLPSIRVHRLISPVGLPMASWGAVM